MSPSVVKDPPATSVITIGNTVEPVNPSETVKASFAAELIVGGVLTLIAGQGPRSVEIVDLCDDFTALITILVPIVSRVVFTVSVKATAGQPPDAKLSVTAGVIFPKLALRSAVVPDPS
jgi:hypothetical protein